MIYIFVAIIWIIPDRRIKRMAAMILIGSLSFLASDPPALAFKQKQQRQAPQPSGLSQQIDFLNNMSDLVTLMSTQTSFGSFSYILAGHYAVFAHILGGILLTFGVLTRFACIIQIPKVYIYLNFILLLLFLDYHGTY